MYIRPTDLVQVDGRVKMSASKEIVAYDLQIMEELVFDRVCCKKLKFNPNVAIFHIFVLFVSGII